MKFGILLFAWVLLSPHALAQATITYFGAERGYTVGSDPIVMLCVVENRTTQRIEARSAKLHCYTINGLDYTSGDTFPYLPLIAPGASVAFRWKLAPSDAKSPLIAGVTLDRVDDEQAALTSRIAVIPRLKSAPEPGKVPAKLAATASSEDTSGWICGDTLGIKVQTPTSGQPLLLLYSRVGSAFKSLGSATFVTLLTSLEGQLCSWEPIELSGFQSSN